MAVSCVILFMWQSDVLYFFQSFRFLSMTRHFYRKANLVVIMYDITQHESFIAVKQWVASLTETFGEESVPPILLLGNKLDLNKKRVIEYQSAKHLATVFSTEHVEVSSKTGENIAEAFFSIVRYVLAAFWPLQGYSNQLPLQLSEYYNSPNTITTTDLH